MWGKDWIQAKTQAECYDYLFQCALEMHKLGLDASRPPGPPRLPAAAANGAAAKSEASASEDGPAAKRHKGLGYGTKLPKCVVLDIEGTVAPISFVADVMFPYAKQHARRHLEDNYAGEECQEDISSIRKQVWGAGGGSGYSRALTGWSAPKRFVNMVQLGVKEV